MSGVETKRCLEGSFLGVYEMVFYSARCGVVFVVGMMATGICFGIVLFLHWSKFVRVLNSVVLLIWISLTGHVVYSGMGGYLLFLVVLLVNPGLRMLLALLRTSLRLLLVLMLLPIVVLSMISDLVSVTLMLVMVLLFGLMVVWLLIRFLGSELLVQGSMRMFRVLLGFIAGGRIWICYLPCLIGEVRGVGCIVLSQVLFRQFRGLRFGGVLVALQGQIALHVGVDNLNVVNHPSSLIAGRWSGRPLPLVNDGDLLGLAREILHSRGRGTTLVSKVKGHADEGLVGLGRVREVDRFGNNEADAAANLGRRRVHDSVTDARRLFISACAHWYPIVRDLQHFFVAIARTVVNHDDSGSTTLHPTVWSTAVNPKRWRFHRAVRDTVWRSTQRAEVTEDDIRVWPFSVGLLVKISHLLATLRWPEGVHDLGVGGVSYLELLILYERWAGRG